MVPLIITFLQWEFVVTTMVFFQCEVHNFFHRKVRITINMIWIISRNANSWKITLSKLLNGNHEKVVGVFHRETTMIKKRQGK